jgi:hypothetical protein
MVVDNRAGLPEADLAVLSARLFSHDTLEQVVRVWLAHEPPRLVAGVIVQDEYSHDVLVSLDEQRFLVYDTT